MAAVPAIPLSLICAAGWPLMILGHDAQVVRQLLLLCQDALFLLCAGGWRQWPVAVGAVTS